MIFGHFTAPSSGTGLEPPVMGSRHFGGSTHSLFIPIFLTLVKSDLSPENIVYNYLIRFHSKTVVVIVLLLLYSDILIVINLKNTKAYQNQ